MCLRPVLYPSDDELLDEGMPVGANLTTSRHSERKEGVGSVCVCVCVCVFTKKLRITAQSGPAVLVIPHHLQEVSVCQLIPDSMYVCVFFTRTDWATIISTTYNTAVALCYAVASPIRGQLLILLLMLLF